MTSLGLERYDFNASIISPSPKYKNNNAAKYLANSFSCSSTLVLIGQLPRGRNRKLRVFGCRTGDDACRPAEIITFAYRDDAVMGEERTRLIESS